MSRERSLGVKAVVGVIGLLMVASPVAAASGAAVKIGEANERYFFAPATAYVNVGGTVTWRNGTDALHTVTSDTGSELDSPTIAAAKTFTHTFAATGTFRYHCTIHPYAVGRVVVLAAGVSPPPTDTRPIVGTSTSDGSIGLVIVVLAGLAGAGLALRRVRRIA
jgi:plastocyanin